MSGIYSNPDIQGTCPSGGKWYTCLKQYPSFLGCCKSDPCNGVGCPSSDLRPAGLGIGAGPDACQNDSSFWPYVACPVGSRWWTCGGKTNPTFQGCCSLNPCTEGSCPLQNLQPAMFATLAEKQGLQPNPSCLSTADFLTAPPTGLAGAPASTTASATSTPASATSTPASATATPVSATPTPLPSVTATKSNPPIAAIAGGVAGGFLVLALLILGFYIYRRRQNRRVSGLPPPAPNQDAVYSHYEPHSSIKQPLSPPPNYPSSPQQPYSGRKEVCEVQGSSHNYQQIQNEYGDINGLGMEGVQYEQGRGLSANPNRVSELSGVTATGAGSPSWVGGVSPASTAGRFLNR